MPRKLTTDEFKSKAIKIHGNKYDYSKVNYINSKTKVILICKEHGEFKQKPNGHLNKRGCKKCFFENKKSTTEDFIKKAIKIHGNRYDYSKVVYVSAHTKVIIGCPVHGDFEQIPNNHLNMQGCKKCSFKKITLTTEKFIKKARLIHGDKYDYSRVVYTNNRIKVIIGCPEHGDFIQAPYKHLGKQGCLKCNCNKGSETRRLTTKEFIKRAKLIHGNKYDYSKVNYISAHEKVIIICREHGKFEQEPNSHSKGRGCFKCSKQGYSQKAINWLGQISKEQNIHIQHAENEGEYHIPGTNYKADGFCKETNTIYEFYGDRFHGNPNLFEEDELCHPFTDERAGFLYIKTKQREQEIKDLGYNLTTIWENNNVNI